MIKTDRSATTGAPLIRRRGTVAGFASLALLAITSIGQVNAQTLTRPMAPTETVRFKIVLPLKNKADMEKLVEAQNTPNSPNYHKWLTPAQFYAKFGPSQQSLAWVVATMTNHHFTVTGQRGRVVSVAGSAADVQKAFDVNMWHALTSGGAQVIVSDKSPSAPAELLGTGAKIAGVSTRAFVHHPHSKNLGKQPNDVFSSSGPYYVDDLKQAYDWPSYQALDATGVTIAITGGADISDIDTAAYFNHLGLPVPNVTRVPVDGAVLGFDPENGDAVEASLDVQQSAGMAPGANILMYIEAENTFVEEVFAFLAVADDDEADVVSNSYGAPEQGFYDAKVNASDGFDLLVAEFENEALTQLNLQGITVVNSSGDDGAIDGYSRDAFYNSPGLTPFAYIYRVRSVDFPASSPHVTSVGGTNLETSHIPGSYDSTYVRENAFFDPRGPEFFSDAVLFNNTWGSGGGVSNIFTKPAYQTFLNTGQANRTVPDVAGHMGGCPVLYGPDPCTHGGVRSSVITYFDGFRYQLIGTSASAPDFAGLLALKIKYEESRQGNINYEIYRRAAGGSDAFRPNIPGDNGWYRSGPGAYVPSPYYNLVVGVGTVDGRKFINATGLPAAGTPRTPTNP